MIGTGISGLGAAYALSKAHDVELFERDDRAGGHSNTVELPVAGRTLRLDAGFIVHNEQTYPNLVRLFRELGVRTQGSNMSFSVACDRHALEYSGSRPPLTRLTLEIARFLRLGNRALDDPRYEDWTLSRYVAEEGYSPRFRDHFLVPLCAALWSTAPDRTLDFPLVYAVRFFANHGMLGFRRFRWKTVTGGSQTYVRALSERLRINLATGCGRSAGSTTVSSCASPATSCGASTALSSRHTPTRRYGCSKIRAATSSGCSLRSAPRRTTRCSIRTSGSAARVAARGSWNYQLRECGSAAGTPTMTYYLNELQRLNEDEHYCVTLNRTDEIDPARIIRRIAYRHPLVTLDSMRAQPELPRLNGPRRTAFAGAWQGYCFHEDGLRSGLAAAAAFGAAW